MMFPPGTPVKFSARFIASRKGKIKQRYEARRGLVTHVRPPSSEFPNEAVRVKFCDRTATTGWLWVGLLEAAVQQ